MIDIIKAVLLGILQGLTEFLPVSSSGHLAIANRFFPGDHFPASFTIVVHLGTMLATVLVFRKDLLGMLLALRPRPAVPGETQILESRKMMAAIIAASVPTALMGFGLKPYFEGLTENMTVVGCMLILTAGVLFITRLIPPGDKGIMDFGLRSSLLVGISQGLAIMPGLSRSGMTISAGLFLKANREFAGRFSFLISLPAILAANVLEFLSMWRDHGAFSGLLVIHVIGFVTSFAVGWGALKGLLVIVKKGRLHYFAFYCLAVGLAVLFLK